MFDPGPPKETRGRFPSDQNRSHEDEESVDDARFNGRGKAPLAALNHHACDLALSKAFQKMLKVDPPIGAARLDDREAMPLQGIDPFMGRIGGDRNPGR